MGEIVIASACRTAIGTFGGTLKDVPAAELGAIVVKEAVKRAGIKPEMVDEVIFGNVLQAGLGQNIARQVTLLSLIHISEPTRHTNASRMPSSA